jgi:CRP-like cAMP-binding protein
VIKARRKRGDFIGEIALIFACSRMADVVAVGEVEVYSLARRDVLKVVKLYLLRASCY